MSLPRRSYDPRRVCLFPMPQLPAFIQTNKRSFGIYLSGALFALGWWFFLDACIISSLTLKPPRDPSLPFEPPATHISFADWVPGLCATIGMIVVNLIDKQHLTEAGGTFSFGGGSGGGFSGDSVQWRARLFLFVGFALLAGGLAGSITVLTVKYLVADLPQGFEYYGVANVVQNSGIMLSTVLLWISQNTESDFEYNLTL
ncbi:uncharacterized protein PFL1_05722 [Pseudozyma flocculosa PF-1]|uniref:Related to membrane protein n=2 Tax=Pseudozyma flocculosa TaxID=84751 RepID=A0A5C3F8Z4_9BASI|nr:uncharacterized protein PFL1_05722 [Pseudozyma flocculosa PF-1]EPQ26743.1 hypothetical protein PFL1_05722 [Pseudozyma flocculosa PF-1]SPO40933.1 related to membrane protein [Pseudozyma flocculosa]